MSNDYNVRNWSDGDLLDEIFGASDTLFDSVNHIRIDALHEYSRRYVSRENEKRVKIDSPQAAYDVLRPLYKDIEQEEVWVLFLNKSLGLIAKERLFVGSYSCSIFDAKVICRRAILNKADSIIVSHNHPSGSLKPSAADNLCTSKLQKMCKICEIPLSDHIILTDEGYYSYNDDQWSQKTKLIG